MIEKNTETPELKPAKMVIRHMSSDERKRNEEWLEEQMKRDEASLKKMWKDEGRAEGIVEGRAEERREICDALTEDLRAKGFSPEMIDSIVSNISVSQARQ